MTQTRVCPPVIGFVRLSDLIASSRSFFRTTACRRNSEMLMRTPARRPPRKTPPMLMDFIEPPSAKSRTYFSSLPWVKHNPSAMPPDGSTDIYFGFYYRLASTSTLPSRRHTDSLFLQLAHERVFDWSW